MAERTALRWSAALGHGWSVRLPISKTFTLASYFAQRAVDYAVVLGRGNV